MAILEGAISGNKAEVDLNGNLRVNLPTGQTSSGYVSNLFENDDGSLFGSKSFGVPYVSERRLIVGLDTPIMDYTFNATAQDTGMWKYVTATMTTTWNTTGLLLNANSTLTTTTGTAISSNKLLTLTGNGSLWSDMTVNITAAPLANQVFECGLFPFAAGTAAPTEGVYFRYTTAGLIGVINYNGTETTTSVMLSAAAIVPNVTYVLTLHINERMVTFWKDGNLLPNGKLAIPAAQGQPFITTALPVTFQFRNSGTVSGAPVMQVKVLDTSSDQKSINLGKPYPHIQAGKGLMGSQGQNGGTMGSTALYTNSLAIGAGIVMTNTTAALTAGFGGQFSTQPTLVAGTDGIVQSFQNPAGGVNQTPRTLYITGVKVQGCVTAHLSGTTSASVVYAYALAYGHTAVSMATVDGSATKAPRRIPLGWESYSHSARQGTLGGNGLYMPFNSPIVVHPGEFVAITAKNIGLVTTAGVISFLVTFDSYYE
jgi:hypothetical protein